jgi:hypothetical protein
VNSQVAKPLDRVKAVYLNNFSNVFILLCRQKKNNNNNNKCEIKQYIIYIYIYIYGLINKYLYPHRNVYTILMEVSLSYATSIE